MSLRMTSEVERTTIGLARVELEKFSQSSSIGVNEIFSPDGGGLQPTTHSRQAPRRKLEVIACL